MWAQCEVTCISPVATSGYRAKPDPVRCGDAPSPAYVGIGHAERYPIDVLPLDSIEILLGTHDQPPRKSGQTRRNRLFDTFTNRHTIATYSSGKVHVRGLFFIHGETGSSLTSCTTSFHHSPPTPRNRPTPIGVGRLFARWRRDYVETVFALSPVGEGDLLP